MTKLVRGCHWYSESKVFDCSEWYLRAKPVVDLVIFLVVGFLLVTFGVLCLTIFSSDADYVVPTGIVLLCIGFVLIYIGPLVLSFRLSDGLLTYQQCCYYSCFNFWCTCCCFGKPYAMSPDQERGEGPGWEKEKEKMGIKELSAVI